MGLSGNLIFWGFIALALLLLALGMFQLARPHYNAEGKTKTRRFAGFMTILAGLLLGAFGMFAWIPHMASFGAMQSKLAKTSGAMTQLSGMSGQMSKLKSENIRLSGLVDQNKGNLDEIARLKGAVSRLDTSNSDLTAEIKRLKGLQSNASTNSDEIEKLKGIIARLNKDNENMKGENTRLSGLLSTNRTDGKEINRLNGIIARLTKDNGLKTTEISGLQSALTKARKRPATAGTSSPLALIHQYNQDPTNLRLVSKDYNIVKARRSELVNGKRGNYYNINVKNPATGKGYKFASASYSQVTPQAAFKKSLDKAIANIKGALDGQRTYQFYVRGKASAGRYNGKLAKGYDYSTIKVLERPKGSKSYQGDLVERKYGPKITNDDLPNLRAAYLQEYITKNYQVGEPIILDGKVSKSKEASKQAVSVMLFVED